MSAPLATVLERLSDAKRSGGGWAASCPAHNDRNPSLSISERDDGQVLLYCHAGCFTEAVVGALGLQMGDLFPRSQRNGYEQPTATWSIKDAEGNTQALHVRFDSPEGKRVVWKLHDSGPKDWGLKGRKPSTLPLYGSEEVKDYPDDVPIIVVEGEKATDALRGALIPAIGSVTGASDTPGAEALEVLRRRPVVLWPDNDEEGRSHMLRIAEALYGVASEVRIYEWKDAPVKGADAADHPAVLSRSKAGVRALLGEMDATSVWKPSPEVSLSPSLKGKDTEDTPKRAPLMSLRFNEIPDPGERRYLVEGLMPEGYPTLLHGDGGVAKSMVALSLGLAVARGGGEWLGHKVWDGGPVLYLDFELDAPEQRRRALRVARGVGMVDAPDAFRYMSTLGYAAQESFEAALRECEEHGVKLLILDSLGPALQGDATAARDVIGFVQRVMEPFRAAGVTVLIVDHQSRVTAGQEYQQKDAFGSVYKRNLTRSVVQVEPLTHQDGALTVRLRHKKHNFGPLAKAFAADLTFAHDSVTVRSRELGSADLATENTLNATDRVKFALEGGPMFPNEVAETTGLALKTVKNALSKLRENGTATNTGETNNVGAKQVSLVSLPLGDGDRDTRCQSVVQDDGSFRNLDALTLTETPA